MPNNICNVGCGVIESRYLNSRVMRSGEKGIAGAETGAQDAETAIPFGFEPVQTATDIDHRLTACVECASDGCNVGVGFSQYPDSSTAIKWIYIGVRCANCGVLGCFAGWKVGQDNVAHLFDKA